MAGEPEALYLVSYPVDGATIARAWISGGGAAKFLLNDGMNAQEFIDAVGAQYINEAYGTSSGTSKTASTLPNFSAFTVRRSSGWIGSTPCCAAPAAITRSV